MNTRTAFLRAFLVAGCALCAAGAAAQQYPSKPMRMIVPAGPGGGVDTIARLVGQPLGAALGQTIVMENRPGAGTMLASEIAAKSPPDGYTMIMVTNSHAINAGIQKNLRYDPVNDFSYFSLASSIPYLVVVHPSVPVNTPKELIALARKRPGQLYFASAGAGSGTHLAGELFISMTSINIVHVPYKSGSPAIVDLAGGHVQIMFSNIINSMPHVKAKRLRTLGITSAKRSPTYPDVPTVQESGVPGYQADAWYGLMGPARIAPEIVARVNREMVTLLKTQDIREKFASQGAEAVANTPEEFAALMRAEITKWGRVTSKLNLQLD
jgi:tripartite-type tricarboxylate transporter receptor subunit TctC